MNMYLLGPLPPELARRFPVSSDPGRRSGVLHGGPGLPRQHDGLLLGLVVPKEQVESVGIRVVTKILTPRGFVTSEYSLECLKIFTLLS